MKRLTLKDLFTPENSGETYVKIAKYREAENEIKELKDLLHRADNKLPIQDRTGLSQEIKQALK
jgi:hypothetical protein